MLGNEFLIPKHWLYSPDPTTHFPLVKIREKAKNRQKASGSGVQDLRKKEGMKKEINERRRGGEREEKEERKEGKEEGRRKKRKQRKERRKEERMRGRGPSLVVQWLRLRHAMQGVWD